MAVTMVYDLETVPDAKVGRLILNLPQASDGEVIEQMFAKRLEQTQGSSNFLQHYLHKIVAISVVVATPEWVKVWSLGEGDSTEAELIQRFFEGIQRYTPNLVSWNGSGFDLPVLHYRALLHKVVGDRYWEAGDEDPTFKWNNYLSRYHARHTDLMDVLAGYQNRAYAPLDELSLMLGLPGKMGMDGSEVLRYYQAGDLNSIRDYCESDVLNTYLIFLRFQLIRGRLSQPEYEKEEERIRHFLNNSGKMHFQKFLQEWQTHA